MISCSSLAREPEARVIPLETLQQIHCLTEAVYHEARGEPVDGQAAVARVVLNRARFPKEFGNSICGVVYKKNQFSWANDEHLEWSRHDRSPVFAEIQVRVMLWMLADKFNVPYVPRSVSEATFFSHGRPKAHNLRFTGAIGHHHFYYNSNFLTSNAPKEEPKG